MTQSWASLPYPTWDLDHPQAHSLEGLEPSSVAGTQWSSECVPCRERGITALRNEEWDQGHPQSLYAFCAQLPGMICLISFRADHSSVRKTELFRRIFQVSKLSLRAQESSIATAPSHLPVGKVQGKGEPFSPKRTAPLERHPECWKIQTFWNPLLAGGVLFYLDKRGKYVITLVDYNLSGGRANAAGQTFQKQGIHFFPQMDLLHPCIYHTDTPLLNSHVNNPLWFYVCFSHWLSYPLPASKAKAP